MDTSGELGIKMGGGGNQQQQYPQAQPSALPSPPYQGESPIGRLLRQKGTEMLFPMGTESIQENPLSFRSMTDYLGAVTAMASMLGGGKGGRIGESIPYEKIQIKTNAQEQAPRLGVSAREVEVPVGAYGKAKVSPEIASFVDRYGYGRSHLNQFLIDAYKSAETGNKVGVNKYLGFLEDDLKSLRVEDVEDHVQPLRDFFDYEF